MSHTTASTTKQLRVLAGLHAGASVELQPGGSYTIGSDESCTVVLCDRGISPKHCLITLDEYGASCRALEKSVLVEDLKIGAGRVAAVDDYQVVHCGDVAIAIGGGEPTDEARWTGLNARLQAQSGDSLAARGNKRANPYVLMGMLLAGVGGLATLAYATLSGPSSDMSPSRVEAARHWLKGIAPPASELFIGMETERSLLLSGYVPFAYQREALTTAARRSAFTPRIEIHAVDQMIASVSRLVQLQGLSCLPAYRTSGQLSCTNTVDSEQAANRLRQIAHEVPGVTALHVLVKEQPKAATPAPPQPAPTTPALTRKFSVLMFRNNRYLVGPYGERYSEGQSFDGLKIQRIGVDEVVFEHEGRPYPFRVAALGARQ
jgi:type III secretion system YscD/HrpQ family protein